MCAESMIEKSGGIIEPKEEETLIQGGINYFNKGQYEPAIKLCKEILRVNPNSEKAYLLWGACLRNGGSYREAIEKLHEAIKINPELYASYGTLGDCYRLSGQYDEAEKQYRKAIELNERDWNVYRVWGTLLRRQERYEEAIEKYKKAIEINPASDNAYLGWGACFREQRLFKKAIERFQKAINVNPRSYQAYEAMGDCYGELGRYDLAEEQYKRSIEINEKNEDAYLAWAALLEKQERYDKAIEKCEKAVEINPESENGYLGWSIMLSRLGRHDEAMKIFKGHLTERRDIPAIHFYGELLMNTEKYKEAEDQFKRVISIEPAYDQVHGTYGELLEKINKKEQAIIEHLKYLYLGPNIGPDEPDFQGIYNAKLKPLISELNPGDYMRQFNTPGKERKFSKVTLGILLILLSMYDTVDEHIKDIIRTCSNGGGQKTQDFDLLIFTIKLSIWLRLCAGSLDRALRLADFYVEYVRALENDRLKEKEIFGFSVSLFRAQIKANINPVHILKVLGHVRKSEGVPFMDVILKIWTCLSDPDSVDAQRYMNETAIGEVVKELSK